MLIQHIKDHFDNAFLLAYILNIPPYQHIQISKPFALHFLENMFHTSLSLATFILLNNYLTLGF